MFEFVPRHKLATTRRVREHKAADSTRPARRATHVASVVDVGPVGKQRLRRLRVA